MKFNLSTNVTISLRLEATEQFEYEGTLWPHDEHPYRALIRTFTASGEPANNPEDLRYTMQGTAIRKDGTAGVFNRTYYGRVWSDLPERVQDGIRAAWRLSVTSGKGLRDWTPPVLQPYTNQSEATPVAPDAWGGTHQASCGVTRDTECDCAFKEDNRRLPNSVSEGLRKNGRIVR